MVRMHYGTSQDLRCGSRRDLQTVPASTEDNEIAASLRLVRQSSQQTTKGVLQVNQITRTSTSIQSSSSRSKPDPWKFWKLENCNDPEEILAESNRELLYCY